MEPKTALAKTALVILATGFEEVEALAPVDMLRRADVVCTIASREEMLLVAGRNGIVVQANELLDQVHSQEFDCIVVPGGPGTAALRADPRVIKILAAHRDRGKLVSAICAAPTVLLEAGILPGHRYTAHSSVADELTEIDGTQAVVVDGNVITSRGAGTAVAFGLALVATLIGQTKAEEIAQSIHFEGPLT